MQVDHSLDSSSLPLDVVWGVMFLLLFLTGCPIGDGCWADADCDDGLFCNGVEWCGPEGPRVAGGLCIAGTPPCTPSEFCNEEADRCDDCGHDGQEPCTDDDFCTTDACVDGQCVFTEVVCEDDGVFCNGDELCHRASGDCVFTGDPCSGDTAHCNEVDDDCDACLVDADCLDDGDLCTTVACDNGVCASNPIECPDDGVFCNGVETCDPATGECISAGDPCPLDDVCFEDLDQCIPIEPCTTDADCSDGLFCNGIEQCEPDGFCHFGTDPCDDGLFCNGVEICNEGNDVCLDGPDPCDLAVEDCDEDADRCLGWQPQLTRGVDVVIGTEGRDSFFASDTTVNTGDFVDGRGGVDRFNWFTSAEEEDIIDVVNTEEMYFRNTFPEQAISLGGFAGITELWYDRGTADLLLYNVVSVAVVGYIGGDGAGDFAVAFNADRVAGSADTLDIILDGADGHDVIAHGFETFNVTLVGENTLNDLVSNNLETILFEGDGSMTLSNGSRSINLHTVNASAAGNGGIAVTISNTAENLTLIGGPGNDRLIAGTGDDDLDGGGGDDLLRGGPGVDELVGGTGANTFVWNDGDEGDAGDTNDADVISDFSLTGDDDVISIEDAGALDVVGAAALVFRLQSGGAAAAGQNVVVFDQAEAAAVEPEAFEAVITAQHSISEAIIAVVLASDDNVYIVFDNDADTYGGGAGIVVLAVIDKLDGTDPTGPGDLSAFSAANFELR